MQDHLVDVELVKHALQLACRAPSLHNSQPWRWVIDRKGVHLFVDRDRIIHGTDWAGREAIISCGVALDHLRVAMAAAGWAAQVHRFPDDTDADKLASVRFTKLDEVTETHRRRADAILLRHTDRLPFDAPRDWESFERLARAAVADIDSDRAPDTDPDADGHVVHLDVIAAESRPRLAEASQLTESQRREDTHYHLELSWWTASYDLSEGIPHGSLVSSYESERVEIGRIFPADRHSERRSQRSQDHSVVLVLSTFDYTFEAALRTGEALSAVLLEATTAGLGTCPLTHITELADSRDIVAELIGGDTVPQVLVRIGRVPPLREAPAPTPRRPLDDVLEVRG